MNSSEFDRVSRNSELTLIRIEGCCFKPSGVDRLIILVADGCDFFHCGASPMNLYRDTILAACMTETTHFTSTDPVARGGRGAPHIAGTAVAFTPHRYNQDEVARELTKFTDPAFLRFARTSGVDQRSLALPLSRYPKLTGN